MRPSRPVPATAGLGPGSAGSMVMTLFMVVLIVLYKWSVKRTAKSDEDDTEAGGLVAAGGKA